MNILHRRRFLALIGAGTIAGAGGAILLVRQLTGSRQAGTLAFQTITRLPAGPLPGYASYVITGQVDLTTRTGSITKAVFAGPPEERTNIALLTRPVQVTEVQQQQGSWHIKGVVSTQNGLQAGEETTFALQLDPSHNVAQSTFFGSPIQLEVQHFSIT
jgi:hypothetical protein